MSEELKYKSLLNDIREVYLMLIGKNPSPDEEIEARGLLINSYKRLKTLELEPKIELLVDECLSKLENWDALELWFSEVPELSNLIGQTVRLTEQELPLHEPQGNKVARDEMHIESEEHLEVNMKQVVEKISEKFKGEIDTLKDEIKRLQQELKKTETPIENQVQTEVETIKIEKKEPKISQKRAVRLPPPEIKLPKIKIPQKVLKYQENEKNLEEETQLIKNNSTHNLSKEAVGSTQFMKRLKKIQEIASPLTRELYGDDDAFIETPVHSEEENQKKEEFIASEKDQEEIHDIKIDESKISEESISAVEVESISDKTRPKITEISAIPDLLSEDIEETEKLDKDLEKQRGVEPEILSEFQEQDLLNEMEKEELSDLSEEKISQIEQNEYSLELEPNDLNLPPPPVIFKPSEKLSPVPEGPPQKGILEGAVSPVPEKPGTIPFTSNSFTKSKKPKISLEVVEESVEEEESEEIPFITSDTKSKKNVSIFPQGVDKPSSNINTSKFPFVSEKQPEKKASPLSPNRKIETSSETYNSSIFPFNLKEKELDLPKKTGENADLIKSSGTELFHTLTSLGKDQSKEGAKKMDLFPRSKKEQASRSNKNNEQKSSTLFFQKNEVKDTQYIEKNVSIVNIDDLPRDKDKLYQELIAFEGKRYNIEKNYKDLEEKHEKGIIDEFDFKNQAMTLKKNLDNITLTINKIRQIISTL